MKKGKECVRSVGLWNNRSMQFADYCMKYKKCQTWSLFDVFYIKCSVRKFMKLLWIKLLTVKSGLSNIHGFQIKVENNKSGELN